MPSSILHDQIPHSLLFPTQPLYFLIPRVFGCTCFVHTLTPGQDKLSAKATKCIFLGYSQLQKGYCCYSFDIHRYFLSAYGTFFEDSPFLSSSEFLKYCHFPIYPPFQMRYLVLFRLIIIDIMLLLLLSFQLRHLMTHLLFHRFILPRPYHLLTICLLLFRKVIALLVIVILFIIF